MARRRCAELPERTIQYDVFHSRIQIIGPWTSYAGINAVAIMSGRATSECMVVGATAQATP
ncbi:hypothetical protein E5D57_002821 [Metarhizium anisopliae]|nr:hypothetical protein E5D57_002821 [Metarhizium anisopliae]